MAEPAAVGPVPRPLRYVAAAVLVGAVAMIFVGGIRIGVTWDESYHVQRFNNYLDTGWYLTDAQRVGDHPGPQVTDQYVYAPATMLLMHGLGVATGVEDPGAAGTSANAYLVRHLGIALISLLGLLAVAGTARLLLRRWDWGLVAAATLAVLPMWAGHSMFNLKDVPVATGYALVTFGLVLVAREDRGRPWAPSVLTAGAIAFGLFLSVGTRPGMWTAMAASIGVLGLCRVLRPGDETMIARLRADLWRLRDVSAGFVVAGLALWAIDPKIFGSPVHSLWQAAFSSANFLGIHSPWYFVPSRVFLQTPFLMLGFVCFGVVVATRRIVRTRLHPGVDETGLLLVFVQVFTLPFIAIVHSASLYGDLRQLLFAAPGTILIATLGMSRLLELARAGRDRRGPAMVAAVSCVALVAPLLDQATLFPYNYAYYNVLTTVGRISVVGEYYRGSARELVPDIPAKGRVVCTPVLDEDRRALRTAHLDGNVDCTTAVASPIAAYRSQRHGDQPPLAANQFWAISFDADGDVPENCTAVAGVTRRTGVRRTHMATLSRCTRDFPVLTDRKVAFREISDLGYLDLGWFLPTIDRGPHGARSTGGPSTMTFRLDEKLAGGPAQIVLYTTQPTAVEASYGGEPVPVSSSSSGSPRLIIEIPQSLVERAVSEPLTLELRSPDRAPLDLKVRRLYAESGVAH